MSDFVPFLPLSTLWHNVRAAAEDGPLSGTFGNITLCRTCLRTTHDDHFSRIRISNCSSSGQRFVYRTSRFPLSDIVLASLLRKFAKLSDRTVGFAALPCPDCVSVGFEEPQVGSVWHAVPHRLERFWLHLPTYVNNGGQLLVQLLPLHLRRGTPLLARIVLQHGVCRISERHVPAIEIADVQSFILWALQSPDSKCVACESSMYPEEVAWLPVFQVPLIWADAAQYGFPVTREKFIIGHKAAAGLCMGPTWNMFDQTPYGHQVSARI